MQSYVKDGYIIIPSLLSPIIQQSLLDAAERVVAKARTAEWPHRRTVGSQFPPYDRQQDTEADVWGVQHVMHPDLDELEFLEWYTSTGIRDVACKLMGCEEGDLQMELFNLLVNPEHTPFALRWHRDDVRSTATLSEEIDALSKRQYGIQWNTALLDDACLFVVPGTHATPLTDEQRSVLNSPWNEPDREGFDPMKMPGAKRVELRAGETLIYNQNILHCAIYTPSQKRITLHACMGNVLGGQHRARNILQHGLGWITSDEFKHRVESLAEEQRDEVILSMWQNLVKLGEGVDTISLGYSHD